MTIKSELETHFAKALGLKDAQSLSPAQADFAAQCLEDYDGEELSDLKPVILAGLMAEVFTESLSAQGKIIKTIKPVMDGKGQPTGYDVLCITQDDAPFIVESLIAELIDQGVQIRALFHPVIGIESPGSHPEAKLSVVMVILNHIGAEKQSVLMEGLEACLSDLRLAVIDFPKMLGLVDQELSAMEALLKNIKIGIEAATIQEDIDFLKWLHADHFVFLGAKGYVYPRDDNGGYLPEEPLVQLQQGYGVLRDVTRPVLRRTSEPAILSKQMLRQMSVSNPITVAKANLKSKVHRRTYMDYVGIKRYGADGQPSGEIRFVGLFTSEAYDRPVFEVPLIRRKAEHVLSEAQSQGWGRGGHNEKRLKNILEAYPRDELYQMSEGDLLRIARGILHLADRPRVRLFTRKDPFDRFISVLFYLPRDKYQVSVQQSVGQALAKAYDGRVSATYAHVGDQILSFIHYIIGVTPNDHLDPDIETLEAEIENLTRAWPERLESRVTESGENNLDWRQWAEAMPLSYRERFSLDEAATDIVQLQALTTQAPLSLRAYRRENQDRGFCFKIYNRSDTILALSDILPLLDNMGLRTIEEYGYALHSWALGQHWVHEFVIALPSEHDKPFDEFAPEFVDTIMAIFEGRTENDGFNALCLAGHSWREVALIRTLCRYRGQSGLDPSVSVQQDALCCNPDVVRALLAVFEQKFTLSGGDVVKRKDGVEAAFAEVESLLRAVTSLEHDRVLRRLAGLIGAITRTNFYQTNPEGQPKPYISVKIQSRDLADLPEPKPYREIFVWAPHVEGVHLRFGPVARGGLRWSDRREDFRTEVLGLVKAQQVKNAVIVPVGSKGGFFPKQLPRGGSPDAIRTEAIRAYKTFLSGLLDLTDNLGAKGEIIMPPDTMIWDDPDPYLVVAADKGTATFSDIANAVSADYGFWLGDAFASGGSVGSDHKVMGITAKGAWEAIKRHFREIGKDIQSETFTCAGVGDMSGDVFGNGMLLSRKTLLVAAFDHRDIFIDPNPDPESSFLERERLFALPRSSWQDYDKTKISKGGGVFSRSLKSIPLSPEIKALLDLQVSEISPFELMSAIMKARVELMYFGGIGTYIKAASETHVSVGDKANDALRVDSQDVRATVIGEGANLGITQAGRIALAQNGARLNTDAIDNSAGVDCSDHEVNIKILLGQLVTAKTLSMSDRDRLLASMTDEVAHHVLAHNYAQTLCLSLQERSSYDDNMSAQKFMSWLEGRGRLDRKVEGLPTNAILEARRANNAGLYRPELAVITAYAKLTLFDDLVATKAPDDPAMIEVLTDYFPHALHAYKEPIKKHRLHREIIATVMANHMVNIMGPSFGIRLQTAAGVDAGCLMLCFEATQRLFGLKALWARVSALDTLVPDGAQKALYAEIAAFARRQTYWLARKYGSRLQSLEIIESAYGAGVSALLSTNADMLSASEAGRVAARRDHFFKLGIGVELAADVAILGALTAATDLIDLANMTGAKPEQAAKAYFCIGERFGIDRLRSGAQSHYSTDEWDRLATRRLAEELFAEQRSLTLKIMKSGKSDPEAAVKVWCDKFVALITPWDRLLSEIEGGAPSETAWSFAKLTIANAALREWTTKAG